MTIARSEKEFVAKKLPQDGWIIRGRRCCGRNHTPSKQVQDADATITMTRAALNKIMLSESSLKNEIGSGEVEIQGRNEAFTELMSLLDTFEFWFNIVTP